MPDQVFEEPPLIISTTGTVGMPITFMADEPVNKANPVIKGTGGIYAPETTFAEGDKIISIQGCNYINIRNLDFQDNSSNTTPEEKMEFGIILYDTQNFYVVFKMHFVIHNNHFPLTSINTFTPYRKRPNGYNRVQLFHREGLQGKHKGHQGFQKQNCD